MIGVTGIATSLPLTFPLEKAENAGNIVHGTAPFRMFPDAYFSVDRRWPGFDAQPGFKDFVNESCSHVIVTQANLFRLGDTSAAIRQRYQQFHRSLEGYTKPIVIFGIGAQSPSGLLQKHFLPEEGVELMKFLGDRCELISVRGEFTARAFDYFAGVKNTFVTGCPSFFSNPTAFRELRERLKAPLKNTSFSATHLQREAERRLLAAAIEADSFYVEPANPDLHRYYLQLMASPGIDDSVPKPKALVDMVADRKVSGDVEGKIAGYFAKRYRMFRQVRPWFDFNREYVDFTYGARFHVNMASLLSGVPALWLTHDSRTRELVETLCLPSLETEVATEMTVEDLIASTSYEEMFDNLRSRFDRFNEYLSTLGLPAVSMVT